MRLHLEGRAHASHRSNPGRRGSLRWRDRRAKLFAGDRAQAERQAGRAFSVPERKERRRLAALPLVVLAVVVLLGLAVLRVSIIRTRYALGATLQRETDLRARERSAAVDVRIARDPHKLRELAAKQGFVRPERVIDLSAGAPPR
jgi:Flp pilus assembly protein TadB